MQKPVSNQLSLATVPILGKAPSESKKHHITNTIGVIFGEVIECIMWVLANHELIEVS